MLPHYRAPSPSIPGHHLHLLFWFFFSKTSHSELSCQADKKTSISHRTPFLESVAFSLPNVYFNHAVLISLYCFMLFLLFFPFLFFTIGKGERRYKTMYEAEVKSSAQSQKDSMEEQILRPITVSNF